ncbi:MAG: hypothetical protein KIT84_26135 [Labilithrix sp.]|nr:hypothetical protein [Labilithrix sp.]MCW5814535.1 hypothetical protein [Labilithrix sp.]
MNVLVPCSACARHVRAGEPACPFCGAARVAQQLVAAPSLPSGLSRAALLLASAAALAACGKEPAPPPKPSPDNTALAPAYGGPPEDIVSAAIYGEPVLLEDAGGPQPQPQQADAGLRNQAPAYGAPPKAR